LIKFWRAATFTWVAEDFLIEHDVQDWVGLPLWLSYKRHWPGFFHIDSSKAIREGLTFSPLSETIAAVIDWETQNPTESPLWLTRKKEQELLKLWKN
jgi:2'-hydroxyisoflavone reductase